MFRLQNNVPPVYVEQSRDFQLLCRLLDCSQGALKYDIDTIVKILDASTIRDTLLNLLCTKVGFFPRMQIEAEVLKYIVAAFPYILRYKGTKKSIEYAANAILKSEYTNIYRNTPKIEINQSTQHIQINIKLSAYNKQALEEVLFYIKPIGYSVTISDTIKSKDIETIVGIINELKPYKEGNEIVSLPTSSLAEIVAEIPITTDNNISFNDDNVDSKFIAFSMVTGEIPNTITNSIVPSEASSTNNEVTTSIEEN